MQIILSLLVTLTLGFSMLQCAQTNTNINKNTAQNTVNPAGTPSVPVAVNPGDEAPRITLADAKKEFDNETAVFVDTRQIPSYTNEHIKGAVNLSNDIFEEHYTELPKDKKLIFYCSCPDEHTSLVVASRIKQKGYTNAYALTGGTPAWKTAGYPMESGAEKQ